MGATPTFILAADSTANALSYATAAFIAHANQLVVVLMDHTIGTRDSQLCPGLTKTGLTFTRRGSLIAAMGGVDRTVEVWTAPVGGSDTTSAAITFGTWITTNRTSCGWAIFEVSGYNTTTPVVQVTTTVDGAAAATSASTAAFSPSTLTTSALLAYWCHAANAVETTPRASWTEASDITNTLPNSARESQSASGLADTNASASWTTSSQFAGIAIEIAGATTVVTTTGATAAAARSSASPLLSMALAVAMAASPIASPRLVPTGATAALGAPVASMVVIQPISGTVISACGVSGTLTLVIAGVSAGVADERVPNAVIVIRAGIVVAKMSAVGLMDGAMVVIQPISGTAGGVANGIAASTLLATGAANSAASMLVAASSTILSSTILSGTVISVGGVGAAGSITIRAKGPLSGDLKAVAGASGTLTAATPSAQILDDVGAFAVADGGGSIPTIVFQSSTQGIRTAKAIADLSGQLFLYMTLPEYATAVASVSGTLASSLPAAAILAGTVTVASSAAWSPPTLVIADMNIWDSATFNWNDGGFPWDSVESTIGGNVSASGTLVLKVPTLIGAATVVGSPTAAPRLIATGAATGVAALSGALGVISSTHPTLAGTIIAAASVVGAPVPALAAEGSTALAALSSAPTLVGPASAIAVAGGTLTSSRLFFKGAATALANVIGPVVLGSSNLHSYFSPPVTGTKVAPRGAISLDAAAPSSRAYSVMAFSTNYAPGMVQGPEGVPGSEGGLLVGGVFYGGGRWHGPLTSAEIAALQAAGYGAAIFSVPPGRTDQLPAST